MSSRYDIFLKTSNLLSYILVLGVNSYFKAIEERPGDDGSDFKGNSTHGNGTHGAVPLTHILPATYTFGIWGLIYALLGGFVIYQWFNSADVATVEGVKFYLILANLGNIVWIVLWRMDYYMLDVFVAACVLLALMFAYNNLEQYPPKSIYDRLFIHYPFTIYPAWLIVATTLNFWVAFQALDTVFFSTIIVAVFGLIGLSFVDYCKRKDVVFAGTLAWSLIGIAVRQYESLSILIAAAVSAGLIIGGILRVMVHEIITWWHLRTQTERTERSPLLPTQN
ncbi:16943_t:CDS:2 [Racocetra persica]|uniref:16943_t:CDS:1 n=1 Tax=Racocetra persica TaxID=160502 RepID=A0ACA9LMW3_9GLOM|nr:16943_t:CDS:2 [Racocetra persica]